MSKVRLPWIHLLLVGTSVLLSLPFFWMVITTFKADEEMFEERWWPALPPRIERANVRFKEAWVEDERRQMFKLNLSERGPLRWEAPAPLDAGRLQKVLWKIQPDGSYHQLRLTVRIGGREFPGERLFLETSRPVETRIALPHVLPNRLELTAALSPTPYYQAVWRKFTKQYRDVAQSLALANVPAWRFFANSFQLVLLNILGQLIACTLVAYGFARFQWPGRDLCFGLLLASMMLPAQVTMIPLFTFFGKLGWYDTLKPLWVPAFFGSPFLIFLLRQFFLTLPKELEEAARLDGCGPLRTLWYILIPQLKPALATVVIFTFMSSWNDFLGPLIYLNSVEQYPLSLGLAFFKQTSGTYWGPLMAMATLMTLPVILLFFFAQRAFLRGLTLTGLKG